MRPLVIALLLALAGCATEQATLTTPARLFAQATDSTSTTAPLALNGKFKGPVSIIVQTGTGNVATPTVKTADQTGQHGQAVSTGPGSPITARQRPSEPPLAVYVVAAVLLLAGWEWASHRGWLAWLPWRTKMI